MSYRKVGGLRFLKIGRLNITFSVTRRHHHLVAQYYARKGR